MSDHRYTAIFGGALLTAGLATFAVSRILGAAATPRHEPVRAVIVAVRDVPAGVPVPREALGIASWPVRVAPAESFAAADSVIGRVTRVPLMAGEPVLVTRLAAHGAAPGLEGTIDPTHRAMAVRVSEAASVSGLVRPNSRVDVLMASRADGGMQPVGRVLMTDVRVLGVGSVRPPEPQGGSTPDAAPAANNMTASIVTLEVTPSQAEQLAAAEGQGALQVVLRGYGSVGDASGYGANVGSVVGAPGSSSPAWPMGGAPRGMGVAGSMAAGAPPSVPVHAVRRSRQVAGSDVASASHHVADTAARAPVRPEPGVIQIYRGNVLTVLHVDAPASAASASGASASPPPALHTGTR
ncbi:MAG: Flp pilus assembly protein CpaB [Candidatus Eremiobacteraeota bacterium]|nr:Flp pilus assembly protein CpaB [Candidatus Eremiobacteraeota bacterium]